jgi:SNF2 family DNA or RNA helicase
VNHYTHQTEILERMARSRNVALWWEPGTGKTRPVVEHLERLYKKHPATLTFIFCPKSVKSSWMNQFETFAPAIADYVVNLTGTADNKLKQLAKKNKLIYVANYEIVRSKNVWKQIQKLCPQVVVCDEVHRLKSPTSLQSKEIRSLKPQVRIALTGTPVLNEPLDLWAQLQFVDCSLVDPNFYIFRRKYFYDKMEGARRKNPNIKFCDWQPQDGTVDRLKDLMLRCGTIVEKEAALDLPELVRVPVTVPMSPKQAKIYRSVESQPFAFTEAGIIDTQQATTKIIRLLQIASGFVKLDSGVTQTLDTGKLETLSDLLQDITPSQKVVVWTPFVYTYKLIGEVCEKLKLEHRFIIGGQTDGERESAIVDFKSNPNIRVMVGNPAAGGVGIDGLQVASAMIYFAKTWNLEHEIQSQARLERGGQVNKMTRYDLLTEGTIDLKVDRVLSEKGDLSDLIMTMQRGTA